MPFSLARRLATLVLLLALAAPAAWRGLAARPVEERPGCEPEGRGPLPRHWLGCAADQGPRRDLSDEERLLLGLPLDPNRATARALAFVPGLTVGIARAVVEDRATRGPYPDVEALDRVDGIGPRRLAQARASLVVAPLPRDAASGP